LAPCGKTEADKAAGEGRNGASVVQINLRFVTDMVAQMRFGVAGQAYIVDSASKLVAHPNLSLVLRGIDLGGKLPAALQSWHRSCAHFTTGHGWRGS
jgi:hypothetical protein